jgi:hypothetical protein
MRHVMKVYGRCGGKVPHILHGNNWPFYLINKGPRIYRKVYWAILRAGLDTVVVVTEREPGPVIIAPWSLTPYKITLLTNKI